MNNIKSGKNLFIKTFFFAVIFSVLVPFMFNRESTFGLSLHRVVLKIIAPIQNCAHSLTSVVYNTVKNYVVLVSLAKENKILKEELALRKMLDNEYSQVKIANSTLRDLLSFKKSIVSSTIAAEVISRSTSHISPIFIINKGSSDGIIKGSPVIVPEGIVGKVIKVIEKYSQVMLVTDPRSSIDALIGKGGARVVAEGCGKSLCSLEYSSMNYNVNIGDMVISSGLDNVFLKNMNIGIVSRVIQCNFTGMLEKVFIRPCVNFDMLQSVLVTIPEHDFG